jgi:rhodanese-related sulfurtransferase
MGILKWLRRWVGEERGEKGAPPERLVPPRKDPFPDHQLLEEITIIDIRTPEEVEEYGELEGAIQIPFDNLFQSRLLLLDRNRKYGILDLRGVYAREAVEIARQVGLEVVELKGGFFYLTEVLNIKPKKRGRVGE